MRFPTKLTLWARRLGELPPIFRLFMLPGSWLVQYSFLMASEGFRCFLRAPVRDDGATVGRNSLGQRPLGGRDWLIMAVLVMAVFLTYQPVWQAGFVWDDDDHLTEKTALFEPGGLRKIWSSLAESRYYPLTLTTFWVEVRLWGLNPTPFHLVNIGLHALNGLLIVLVLRRLHVVGAMLAAALWTLHPVNVESVAWITEMKNTQSGVFFFLAVLFFLKSEHGRQWRWYVLSFGCGLAALLSKPSTVILPATLGLCIWWQRGKWEWRDLFRLLPFAVAAAAMSVLAVMEQRGHVSQAHATAWSLNVAERLVVASTAIWFYVGKLLWPLNLAFIYPRWQIAANVWWWWLPLLGVIGAGMLLWSQREQPWVRGVTFGLVFFVLALLPVLGFFDVYFFIFSYVADHFQYLASLGIITLVAAGVACSLRRAEGWRKTAGQVACVGLLVVLAMLSWRQSRIYQNIETLFQATITRNPECWMAHNNLGLALAARGRGEEAIRHYREALRIHPNFPEALTNLGMVLAARGQVEEAMRHYREALRIKPDSPQAHFNLGNALAARGQMEEAMRHYREALRIRPNFPEALTNLGNALAARGQVEEAIRHYREALRIKPDFSAAHLNLGNALAAQGQMEEAMRHYRECVRLQPNQPEAMEALAWILATHPQAKLRDGTEAVCLAERARQLRNREHPSTLDTLAAAYAESGRFAEAVAAARKAAELATALSQRGLAAKIEQRLRLYTAGQPYRDPAQLDSK